MWGIDGKYIVLEKVEAKVLGSLNFMLDAPYRGRQP